MEPNLLVSYDSKAGYLNGKNEIHNILTKLGDQKSEQELLVPGVIGVKTSLDARRVVEDVRELFLGDPSCINATLKWVPVDFWCNVEEIKSVVKEEIKDLVVPDDHYIIEVVKHRSALDEKQIVDSVAPMLKGKINLEHPQKILRIELFDKRASVTLLKPKDIFSVR